jgi:hypothetical protein
MMRSSPALSRKKYIALTFFSHSIFLSGELFHDVQPFVQSALDGYNISIFAYGQSRSGKTHTLVSITFLCHILSPELP